MKLKILTIALSIVFLSGCALTTEQVNLNYQPSHKPIRKTHIATPIRLDPVVDARGLPANLIRHKTDENGDVASGGYAASKPVASYLEKALHHNLKASGYNIVNGKTNLHLHTKLLSINSNRYVNGLFGPDKIYSVVTVEFSLNNVKTGRQLWDETLYAKTTSGHQNALANTINAAFNQITINLATNKTFQTKLHGE